MKEAWYILTTLGYHNNAGLIDIALGFVIIR